MISMYTGTPGSGKSLHAAKTIYEKLRYGKNVIANFPFDDSGIEYFRDRHGYFFHVTNEELLAHGIEGLQGFALNFHKVLPDGRVPEGQTVIVLDEAQLLFNARTWSNSERLKWAGFFSVHRHYGFDVILLTQLDEFIDRQIRAQVEHEFIHRNVTNFRWFGALLGLLFHGALFISIHKWYVNGELVGNEYFVGRKKWYALYNTSRLFSFR